MDGPFLRMSIMLFFPSKSQFAMLSEPGQNVKFHILLQDYKKKNASVHNIYIRIVSSGIFPGWSGAEIKCIVHIALPKLPLN